MTIRTTRRRIMAAAGATLFTAGNSWAIPLIRPVEGDEFYAEVQAGVPERLSLLDMRLPVADLRRLLIRGIQYLIEGLLEESIRCCTSFLENWPELDIYRTTAVNAVCAARLRSGNYLEAYKAAKRYSREDDPNTFVALALACKDCFQRQVKGKPSGILEADTIKETGQLILSAELNGVSVKALIDTGFGVSGISADFAKTHGIVAGNHSAMVRAYGGSYLPQKIAIIEVLKVADRSISPLPVVITDLSKSPFLSSIDVVIGSDVLASLECVFLLKRKSGAHVFAFRPGDKRTRPNLMMPMHGVPIARMILNSANVVNMAVDTGASVTTLIPATVKSLGVNTHTRSLETAIRGMDVSGQSLRLDTVVNATLKGAYGSLDSGEVAVGEHWVGSHLDGTIGMNSLTNGFVIDYKAFDFGFEPIVN